LEQGAGLSRCGARETIVLIKRQVGDGGQWGLSLERAPGESDRSGQATTTRTTASRPTAAAPGVSSAAAAAAAVSRRPGDASWLPRDGLPQSCRPTFVRVAAVHQVPEEAGATTDELPVPERWRAGKRCCRRRRRRPRRPRTKPAGDDISPHRPEKQSGRRTVRNEAKRDNTDPVQAETS
jgi:hypothetical protein